VEEGILNDHRRRYNQPLRVNALQVGEATLWEHFKQGDEGAYALIYRRYFFDLYQYGKKISDDQDLIKDCIQDLFVKLWHNRENLNQTTSVKYYLFTSLKHKILDVLKSAAIRYRAAEDLLELDMADENANDEVYDDQREDMLRALNTLSRHQQKLLHLKFNKQRTNQEIAAELGITIQSVYNAVFKALRSLRKQLH
jgi:RNA polymerase sigma factor (sigma-70 family)